MQAGAGAGGAGTSGVNTGAVGGSNPGTVTAAATGASGLSALGPLIGDVVILGVDTVASPFAMTQTITRAIAAGAMDLGAGDMQAAQSAVTHIIEAGMAETQTRIADDKNNIGAALARLMGKPSTTTDQVGTANSVTGAAGALAAAKTTSTPAVAPHLTSTAPGPVVTRPTSSTTAEAVAANHEVGTAHNPATTGTTTAGSPTASQQAHTAGTTTEQTKGGSTTGTTKPATHSSTGTGTNTASTDRSTRSTDGLPFKGARQCCDGPGT